VSEIGEPSRSLEQWLATHEQTKNCHEKKCELMAFGSLQAPPIEKLKAPAFGSKVRLIRDYPIR
jgi:hypothetical protein